MHWFVISLYLSSSVKDLLYLWNPILLQNNSFWRWRGAPRDGSLLGVLWRTVPWAPRSFVPFSMTVSVKESYASGGLLWNLNRWIWRSLAVSSMAFSLSYERLSKRYFAISDAFLEKYFLNQLFSHKNYFSNVGYRISDLGIHFSYVPLPLQLMGLSSLIKESQSLMIIFCFICFFPFHSEDSVQAPHQEYKWK